MKRALLTALVTVAVVIVPLALTGVAHGRALLAYVLLLGAIAFVLLIESLRRALPRSSLRRSPRSPAPEPESLINQFEKIRRAVSASVWTETYVYHSLRPIVYEIVATSLMRRHGVNLDRTPQLARSLLGDGYAWDLVRPDRSPPLDTRARGWSREELDKLIEELEAL